MTRLAMRGGTSRGTMLILRYTPPSPQQHGTSNAYLLRTTGPGPNRNGSASGTRSTSWLNCLA